MSGSSRFTGKSWTPFALARSSYFDEWRVDAEIFISQPSVEEREEYGRLSNFQLPLAILESEDAKQRNKYRSQDIFYEGLTGWAVSHQETMVDGDVHDIASLSQALYVSFFRLHHSVNNNAVELTQRRAIDDIVEMAFMARKESIHSVVHEGRLRLRATNTDVVVGVKAAADSLALVPLPQDLWERIFVLGGKEKHVLDRAFWAAHAHSEPTLPRFTGEFKRNTANQNRNQLMIDMATFQSQLRALGITEILWGATYAGGVFEIFSSRSNGTKTVISSHGVSNLTDPVNFLKCYSFMANLALGTGPFLENLKLYSADKIIGSMRASAWRAPSPPPTITDTKSEIRSAVDIGMSSKRPKPDSDSDGDGDGGDVNPKGRKRTKEPGGVSRGIKDRSGRSAAHSDAKSKGRAHAGGSGGDGAKDRMESLDSALHDDNLYYRASVGSATFCEEQRIEALVARQPTSCSLKRGFLEAHTVLSRPVTPSFYAIEKWRSSISI